MIKNKKVPEIRFKGFTGDWEQHKVGELLEERNIQTPKSDEYPLMAFIQNQGVAPKGDRYNRDFLVNDVENKKYKQTEKGDFIYSSNNLETGSIGLNNYGNAVISPVYSIFKPTKIADSSFLGNSFTRKKFINEMIRWRQGVVYGQWKIHESDFIQIDTFVPGINEQNRIGEYLSNIDNLITLHQRKYEKLIIIKKSMLEKMFPKNPSKVPEIRFKGFIEDWEQREFNQFAKYRNGKAHENDICEDGKYIVVNSKFCSTDGEVKKYSNNQNEPLYKNDIAFVLSDVPNGRALARTFLVEKDDKYTLNQRIAGITPLDNTDPYYLYIMMNHNRYFLQFDDGAKQTNLSTTDVFKFEEMFPNKEEQENIGNIFKQIDNLITLHQRKLEKLNNIKKSLLDKMFV